MQRCKQITAKERRTISSVAERVQESAERVKEAVKLAALKHPDGFHKWMDQRESRLNGRNKCAAIDRFLHHVGMTLDLVDVSAELKRMHIVLDEIDSVPDARLQYLMILRYLEGLTWEETATKMHMSVANIHRLHRESLGYIE